MRRHMKRTSGGRPKNEDVLARKRALIRSLIEQTSLDAATAELSSVYASPEPRKLAPIIPFPIGGKIES